MSVAKDQRTTYNLYLDALIEKGLATVETNEAGEQTFTTTDQYMGMLKILKDKELPNGQGNDWMRRVVVKRNVHEMNNAMNELMQVALTIQRMSKFLQDREGTDLGHSNPIYRTINDNCSWDCGYKSMCIAGMDGSDVRYLEDEFLMPVTSHYEMDGEV